MTRCDGCGKPVNHAGGPSDGWQVEGGRTLCQECCARDLREMCARAAEAVSRAKAHSLAVCLAAIVIGTAIVVLLLAWWLKQVAPT